ncbi:MAG TPA: class I mannose-6-phosphate isomerase [Spirochaetales bacterium]|nr:class I mannose-6-phosphate isomerase [Spirochaetales bacterium]
MSKNKPFMLKPASKDYLWGGSRLNDDFNMGLMVSPLAEAWMCSTHPDGISQLENGELLSDALKDHPEWLGSHVLQTTGGKPELPILIKLIDAKKDLSVQVHPDDEYALKNEGELGKTEMWYVLAAENDSELIYGFKEDMEEAQVREALTDGSIGGSLNHVPVKKNDVFFIEAGTVHGIGAGCLIAEIQESSNLTYRMYDYDRVDKHGQKRPLHIDKALAVANLSSSAAPVQPMRVLKYRNGSASELLTRCKYFQVERLLLNTENRKLAHFQTEDNSFHALLCVEGCGVLFGKDFMLNFYKGDCIFVPANSIPLELHGKAQLLNISC